MQNNRFILFFAIVTLSFMCFPQTSNLQKQITDLINTKDATIGIGIYNFDTNETLIINGQHHYPMQSVFKFHLALAVLKEVDEGNLSLDQKIHIIKVDLLPDTWSPLRDKYLNGNIDLQLRDILYYTVSRSDNNGCDILFKLLGGPETVNKYIHSLGINDISIKATEAEMHKAWEVQYGNWTTPLAAVKLLAKFYNGKILSESSFNFLWKLMSESTIGKDRIKDKLPDGTNVAHKTGLSATDEEGITAATNDIGIVTLPNGKHYAIAVFVSDSKENEKVNAGIISGISKIAWDYFNKN
ncbi:MAG TPA: class A beta-lactamase, subclass A2 [Ignavibacteriaceae bacterium]|nr:class A beta-lactamase, subclass A2 [Ignavibacteriaceae bacterium]